MAVLRAAIYCRKSSDDRRGSGKGEDDPSLSVKAQESDCRRAVEREGWNLVAVLADDGISGRTWPEGKDYEALAASDSLTNDYIKSMGKKRRPGLGALLDGVKRREIDVIVVRDAPRLARPIFQSALQNFLPSFIQSNKVRILSLADGLVDYSDFGKALSLFLSEAILDKELKTRAKHSKEARKREWASGRFLAHVPFGYVRDANGKLAQHPGNAKIIREFFEKSAKGASTASIAREYTQSGRKSPTGKALRMHTLRDMLMNPIYMGKVSIDGRLIKCVDVDDPIVPEAMFHKIAKMFESRKGIKSNRSKSTGGPATGIIKCGLCGSALIHWKAMDGSIYRRYNCSRKLDMECRCSISANNLDEFLDHFIPLKSILERRQMARDAEEKSQLPGLLAQEKELNEKIAKYEERILSEDMELFIDVFKKLKTELLKVQRRIAELENIPDVSPKKSELKIFFGKEEDGLPMDEKRNIMRSVFRKITVFPKKVLFDLITDESFVVKRIDLGRKRIGIPPAHFVFEDTGKHLEILMAFGIDKSLKLLDGQLLITKVDDSFIEERIESKSYKGGAKFEDVLMHFIEKSPNPEKWKKKLVEIRSE